MPLRLLALFALGLVVRIMSHLWSRRRLRLDHDASDDVLRMAETLRARRTSLLRELLYSVRWAAVPLGLTWAIAGDWVWVDASMFVAAVCLLGLLISWAWREFDPRWSLTIATSALVFIEIFRVERRVELRLWATAALSSASLFGGLLLLAIPASKVGGSGSWVTASAAVCVWLLWNATFGLPIVGTLLVSRILSDSARIRILLIGTLPISASTLLSLITEADWNGLALAIWGKELPTVTPIYGVTLALLALYAVLAIIGSSRWRNLETELRLYRSRQVTGALRVLEDSTLLAGEAVAAARNSTNSHFFQLNDRDSPPSPPEFLGKLLDNLAKEIGELEPRHTAIVLPERKACPPGSLKDLASDIDRIFDVSEPALDLAIYRLSESARRGIGERELWQTASGWQSGIARLQDFVMTFNETFQEGIRLLTMLWAWVRAPAWLRRLVSAILPATWLSDLVFAKSASLVNFVRDLEDLPENDPRWRHLHRTIRLRYVLLRDEATRGPAELIADLQRLSDHERSEAEATATAGSLGGQFLAPLAAPLFVLGVQLYLDARSKR